MASRFTELAVDARDPARVAKFWSEVLGYQILETDEELVEIGAAPLEAGAIRQAAPVPSIVFVKVPEEKTIKNRVHIDVSPIDRDQPSEVQRIIALGAREIDIGQGEQSWTVLADPEGNEFCVLRSLQTR